MTSLTKKSLFAACKLDIKEHNIEGWGTVYLKTMTEMQRSSRIADMFTDKGDLKPEARLRQRVNVLIDRLCDKDGKSLFNEGDAKDLLKLDADKLDGLFEALDKVIDEDESGNA